MFWLRKHTVVNHTGCSLTSPSQQGANVCVTSKTQKLMLIQTLRSNHSSFRIQLNFIDHIFDCPV